MNPLEITVAGPVGAAPPTSGAPPGAPPPTHPFQDALADEWARTAQAEGRQKGSPTGHPGAAAEERPHHASHEAPPSAAIAPQAPSSPTPAPAARAQGQEASAHTAEARSDLAIEAKLGTASGHAGIAAAKTEEAPGKGAPAPAPTPTQAPTTTAPAPGETPTDGLPGALGASGAKVTSPPAKPSPGGSAAATGPPSVKLTIPGVPASGTQGPPQPPQDPEQSLAGAFAPRSSAPGSGAPAGPPSPPQSPPAGRSGVLAPHPLPAAPDTAGLATALATALGGSGSRQQGGSRTADGSPATVTAGSRPTAAPATGLQDVLPAPVAGAAGLPSAPGTLLGSGVQMQDMIEAIHATIELAARQGVSQARISLEPAELGEIRIHLSQTSDGLLARVTAETPAAAQALSAGRGELHQALSSLGTSLLRLDIGSSGLAQGREGRQAEPGTGGSRRSGTTGGEESIEAAEGSQSTSAAAPQALGELVDVLA